MEVIENNMDESQKGYTKEKADRLIKEHEDRAIEYERQAEEAKEHETFDTRGSNELRGEARREREKADNMKALKKHWGD